MRSVSRSALLSPLWVLVGPFCARAGVSYASSTERMTQGPPRFCLKWLPAESARFLIENACDFCTETVRFDRFFAQNRMFSARFRRCLCIVYDRRITPAFASEMTASSFASTFAAKSKKTPGSPSQETGDDVMNNTVFTRYVQDTILFVIRQIRAPNIASQNRLNT